MQSLLRLVTVLITATPAATFCSHAQTAAPATYDVSTVKLSAPGKTDLMLNWAHAQLKADNVTLGWILTAALHVRRDQIEGLSEWSKEQHYDITAKLLDTDEATVDKMSQDQHRALLLALLVERFGLKYHVETKEMPTYDLLPSKKGLKLTAAADSGDKTKKVYGLCSGCASWGNHAIKGHDLDFAAFSELLAGQVERNVDNHTGYTGKIDVDVKWAADLGSKPASDEDAALPPLQQALEDQMGLRLVSTKGPVKLYVIDHLDKPSAN